MENIRVGAQLQDDVGKVRLLVSVVLEDDRRADVDAASLSLLRLGKGPLGHRFSREPHPRPAHYVDPEGHGGNDRQDYSYPYKRIAQGGHVVTLPFCTPGGPAPCLAPERALSLRGPRRM